MNRRQVKNRRKCKPDPDKTLVIAVVDHDSGAVVTTPVHEVTAATATARVEAAATLGAKVHTNGSPVYDGLAALGYAYEASTQWTGTSAPTGSPPTRWRASGSYVETFHWWSGEHTHRYVDAHTFLVNRRRRHVTARMGRRHRCDGGKAADLGRAGRRGAVGQLGRYSGCARCYSGRTDGNR